MSSNPWCRQLKESPKAYLSFCLYRDAGLGRSLREVAQRLGRSLTAVAKLSSRHNWVQRAEAWDDHMEEIERRAWERECEKTAQRHAQVCMLGLSKAIDGLANYNPANYPEAVQAAINLMRFERLCRGLPSEIAKMRHEGSSEGQPIRSQQLNITEVVVRNRKDIDDLRRMMGPNDRLLFDPGPLPPTEGTQDQQPAAREGTASDAV
jgi:hypothetical protein